MSAPANYERLPWRVTTQAWLHDIERWLLRRVGHSDDCGCQWLFGSQRLHCWEHAMALRDQRTDRDMTGE